MLTFDDIQNVFATTSQDELAKSYTQRQKYNKLKNNKIAEEVVNEITLDPDAIPGEYNTKIQLLISALITGGKADGYMIAKRILEAFRYQKKQEIIVACQYIDNFTTKDINPELFSLITNGLIAIRKITKNSSGYIMDTELGSIKITNACDTLNIEQIPQEQRRGLCHNITTYFLVAHPNFYGSYHYLPQSFVGHLEHSVVIDPDNNIVYDLANNTAMNLQIWQSLFPNAFVISGKDIQELFFRTIETYHTDINMATLEEVRRRTIK